MHTEVKPDRVNQNTGDRGSFTQVQHGETKEWARRVYAHIAHQPIRVSLDPFLPASFGPIIGRLIAPEVFNNVEVIKQADSEVMVFKIDDIAVFSIKFGIELNKVNIEKLPGDISDPLLVTQNGLALTTQDGRLLTARA